MNRISTMLRAYPLRLPAALLAAALLAGCGGGSSSSTPKLQGNAATRAVYVAGYQSLAAGMSYPFVALQAAAPTGSVLKSGGVAAAAVTRAGLLPALIAAAHKTSTRAVDLTFVPALALYVAPLNSSGNTLTLNYYTDAAGTQSAGSVVITLPASAGGSTTYPSYPVQVPIAINLTGGNLPCTGQATITFTGASGANSLTGTLNLPKNNITVKIQLSLTDAFDVGGTVEVQESGADIHLTNVHGNLFETLQGDVQVAPYGWTGQAQLSLLDGTISITLNIGTKTSSATTDTSGSLQITYADGSQETVSNPILATLVAGSGSGSNGGSSNGGSSNGGGTNGGTTNGGSTNGGASGDGSATYHAPVLLNFPQGYLGLAHPEGITQNGLALGLVGNATGGYAAAWSSPSQFAVLTPLTGTSGVDTTTHAYAGNSTQIVGGSGNSFYLTRPVVWSSPGYSPQLLQSSDFYGVALAINASGGIVGIGGDAFLTDPIQINLLDFGHPNALYWPNSGAAPIVLQPLVTGGHAGAFGINASGQIVGMAYNASGSLVPVYWSSPTAAPVALQLPSGNYTFTIAGIDGAGHIAGYADDKSTYGAYPIPLYWSAPTAAPTQLPLPSGGLGGRVTGISGPGLIVGYVNTANGTDAAVWKNQQVENLNDTLPAGSSLQLEVAQAVNDQGVIVGMALGNNGNPYFTLTPK